MQNVGFELTIFVNHNKILKKYAEFWFCIKNVLTSLKKI